MLAAALISIVPVEEIIWKTGQVSVEPHAFQRAALRLIVPEIKVGCFKSGFNSVFGSLVGKGGSGVGSVPWAEA